MVIKGRWVTFLIRETTLKVSFASLLNSKLLFSTLGQERFISKASISFKLVSFSANSTKSLILSAAILTITGIPILER